MPQKILISQEIPEEQRQKLVDRLQGEGYVIVDVAAEAELIIAPEGDEVKVSRAIDLAHKTPPRHSPLLGYSRHRAMAAPAMMMALTAMSDSGWPLPVPRGLRDPSGHDARHDEARRKTASDLARMEAAKEKQRLKQERRDRQRRALS